MKILVTGAAGFIGAALSKVLSEKHEVYGIDSINAYYDPRLKIRRMELLGFEFPKTEPEEFVPCVGYDRTPVMCALPPYGEMFTSVASTNLHFMRLDIADRGAVPQLFRDRKFDIVINLAAQAGVRYSIENPFAYAETNILGFLNLLESARLYPPKHFIYASSSSVYGGNTKTPFSETDRVDDPVSLYAATKKSNELMASVYAGLYGLNLTGLRFFTVYGPWGRPDMAPMLFAEAIRQGKPIKVFNHGDMRRDFTYIDDIVEGICRVMELDVERREERVGIRKGSNLVFNIGGGQPENLMDFINYLQESLGEKAQMEMLPMQPGDVPETYADTHRLEELTGFCPKVPLKDGVEEFARWFDRYKNRL